MNTIRRATRHDLSQLATLDEAVFGAMPYPGFFFRQAMELWPEFLLLSENRAGDLQGYLLAAPSASPRMAWILSLAVRESARGRGVGKALVRAAVLAMRQKGISTVRLATHPENFAVGLYQKLEFRMIGSDPDYYQDGEPRVIMELGTGE